MRRPFSIPIQRELSNRKPQLWNVVRSTELATGGALYWSVNWEDKVIARNLTERQAVALIRKLERRTGNVTYGGEAVGRESHRLVA